MHNGVVAGFDAIKRDVISHLSQRAFDSIQSFHCDSAVAFGVFLHFLEEDQGDGDEATSSETGPRPPPPPPPRGGPPVPPHKLRRALEQTVSFLVGVQQRHGCDRLLSLLNFVVSDGETVIASRFVWPPDGPLSKASSLYYTEGSSFAPTPGPGGVADPDGGREYAVLRHGDRGSHMALVASEPITDSCLDWIPFPTNHAVVLFRGNNSKERTRRAAGDGRGRCDRSINVLRFAVDPHRLSPTRGGALPPSALRVHRPLWVSAGVEEVAAAVVPAEARGRVQNLEVDQCLLALAVEARPCRGPVTRPRIGGPAASTSASTTTPAARDADADRAGTVRAPPPTAMMTPAVGSSVPHNFGLLSLVERHRAAGGQRASTSGPRPTPHTAGGDPLHPVPVPIATADDGCLLVPETGDKGDGSTKVAVQALAVHAGRVYSAGSDGVVRCWCLSDASLEAELRGHMLPVLALLVDAPSDGPARLLSLAGRTLRVWSLDTHACLAAISLEGPGQTSGVLSVALYEGDAGELRGRAAASGRVWAARADAGVERWYLGDWETSGDDCGCHGKERLAELELAAGGSADAERAHRLRVAAEADPEADDQPTDYANLAGRRDGAVGHLGSVMAVVQCGGVVASASTDGTVRTWTAGGLVPIMTFSGHRGAVTSLGVLVRPPTAGDSAQKSERPCLAGRAAGLVVAGGRDGALRVLDLEGLVCRGTLLGHTDAVLHVTDGSADGDSSEPDASPSRVFASTSADGTVRVWSLTTWRCVRVVAGSLRAPGVAAAASIAAASSALDEAVVESDNDAHEAQVDETAADRLGLTALLLPDRIATGTAGGAIRFWNLPTAASAPRVLPSPSVPHAAAPPPASAPTLSTSALSRDLAQKPALSLLDGFAPADEGVAPPPDSAAASAGAAAPPKSASALDARILSHLGQFIAIPSISPDPLRGEDCFRAAMFTARLLEMELGAEVTLSTVPGGNPVVLGRVRGRPDGQPGRSCPTVVFYGHYDVQPAHASDGWNTPPFRATQRNGYVYGRGASDNKGPVLALIFAARTFLEEERIRARAAGEDPAVGSPLSLSFIIEGEDETGSRGFCAAVRPHAKWLGVPDVCCAVVSNTSWVGERVPCLTEGMRGMISLSIDVKGPKADVHSGDGGVFAEPMADLVRILASLIDDGDGRCTVEGFHHGVVRGEDDADCGGEVGGEAIAESPSGLRRSSDQPCAGGARAVAKAAKSAFAEGEFSAASFMRHLGVKSLTVGPCGPSASSGSGNGGLVCADSAALTGEILRRRWCEPCLSITDLRVAPDPAAAADDDENDDDNDDNDGETNMSAPVAAAGRWGPTRFSVVPAHVTGFVSVRYVPAQRAQDIVAALRRHVARQAASLGRGANRARVRVIASGSWWEADRAGSARTDALYRIAAAALERVWGRGVLRVREGGTMPVAAEIEGLLQAPAVLIPMGQASDAPHLPNERLRVANLLRGRDAVAAFLGGIAAAFERGEGERLLGTFVTHGDVGGAAAVGGSVATAPAGRGESRREGPPPT